MLKTTLKTGDALLVIHVQNDFLPGGALAVPCGDEVVAPLNAYIESFLKAGFPVLASRDWHPPNHCSFKAQGGPWPPHCVAGTAGASFSPALKLPADAVIVDQATDPSREAYSGFAGTCLDEELRKLRIERLFMGGVSTDYCVLETVLDGLALGYEVFVLTDALRPIDARPGDGEAALERMRRAGAVTGSLEIAFQ